MKSNQKLNLNESKTSGPISTKREATAAEMSQARSTDLVFDLVSFGNVISPEREQLISSNYSKLLWDITWVTTTSKLCASSSSLHT
jgi:hypothetical protein